MTKEDWYLVKLHQFL